MKTTQRSKYKIFISYASGHNWEAHHIRSDVQKICRAEVFLDVANMTYSGDDVEDQIFKALAGCDEIWILLTPAIRPLLPLALENEIPNVERVTQNMEDILPGSLERHFVWMEVGAALVRRIPMVGLVQFMTIPQLRAQKNVPESIKRRRLVDMSNHAEYEALLEETRQRVIQLNKSKRQPQKKVPLEARQT